MRDTKTSLPQEVLKYPCGILDSGSLHQSCLGKQQQFREKQDASQGIWS